jgi:hypothetical protein
MKEKARMVPVQTQVELEQVQNEGELGSGEPRQPITQLGEVDDTMFCQTYIWDICPL